MGSAIGYLFYHIAKHAAVREKLYKSLAEVYGKTIPGQFKDSDLATLEYLDAVINESMRIVSPGGSNAPRNTPPEGIEVDGVFIPGNVKIFTPIYAFSLSMTFVILEVVSRAFKSWLTLHLKAKNTLLSRRNSFPNAGPPGLNLFLTRERSSPSSKVCLDTLTSNGIYDANDILPGPFSCVGKRLALMLIRLLIANTLWSYDFEFAPGEDGNDIFRKARNQLVVKPGKLNVVFTKRT